MSPVFRKKRSRAHNSPRLILFKQIFVGLVCFSVLGLLGYGVWYVSHLESLNIDTVKVSGGQTIEHNVVRDTAVTALEGSYYKLIPRSFAWAYPKSTILDAVSQIPRVKSVLVDELDSKTIQVQIEEYVPQALWCDSSNENCLFLDEDGYAFSVAPPLSGSAFLRYQSVSRLPEMNITLTDYQVMQKTAELTKTLDQEFELTVSYVEIGDRSVINYYLIGGGSLKTLNDQTNEDLLENLAAILNSEEFSHLRPGNFQYIDLRFGDKVFIKEEEIEPEEPEDVETVEETEDE